MLEQQQPEPTKESVRAFLMKIAQQAAEGSGTFLEPAPDIAVKAASEVLRSFNSDATDAGIETAARRLVNNLIINAK